VRDRASPTDDLKRSEISSKNKVVLTYLQGASAETSDNPAHSC
jgi:hypothetical protein